MANVTETMNAAQALGAAGALRAANRPAEAERLKMPDACTTCHTDKTPAWATAALRTWPELSPWRVGQ